MEKKKKSQKNIYFCFIDYAKAFDCVDYNKLENCSRDGNTRPPDLPPEDICMQVKKQQLEPDMDQQSGSKLGKDYVKAVYCHPAYLIFMQSLVQFSRSVVSDSLRSHRLQHTRLPRPWDSPGKNSGVGCHFLLQCMKVKSVSQIAQLYPALHNPMK